MEYWLAKAKLSPEEQKAFEKLRLDYCYKMYEIENERKKTLEKKSQFYLSLITLFIGGLFLKLDFIKSLDNIFAQQIIPRIYVNTFLISVAGAGILILISLITILQSIVIREYKDPTFKNTVYTLFSPESIYKDDLEMLRGVAMMYTIALEYNSKVNSQKAKYIKIASYCVVGAIFLLSLFVATSLFILLSF